MNAKKRISTKGKILIAVIAVILCAAIITGICIMHEHNRYACQYASPFSYTQQSGGKVQLVAHRGLAVQAPENTLPAYEKAAQAGFRYVETDIRATADGVWVLSHDASLKRMTGFSGKVEELTLAEVQQHPINKGGHIQDYPNLTTPTYEAFIRLCKENNLCPLIEIKTEVSQYPQAPYKEILNILRRYGMVQQAIIISFDADALECIRTEDADIAMQYLIKEPTQEAFTKAEKLGNCGIDCEYKALLKEPEYIEIATGAGMQVNVWTVDHAADAAALADAGVDFITTNAAMPS